MLVHEATREGRVVILEEVVGGYGPGRIRALLERHDLVIQEWDRVHTDWVTIRETDGVGSPAG